MTDKREAKEKANFMYRYDMHVHSAEGSACGRDCAADMVRAFAAAGYAGFVLTDHSCCGNSAAPRDWPWERRIRVYEQAYQSAAEAGRALDFDVLFGWEHHYGHGREALTYGIDIDFLLKNPDIPGLTLAEYAGRVRAAGGYVALAHPYRVRDYIDASVQPQPEAVDGVEVYNDANRPEENRAALRLAESRGLGMVSGSDAHSTAERVGTAGLAFARRIRANAELVAALRAGEGKLIVRGEILPLPGDFSVSP